MLHLEFGSSLLCRYVSTYVYNFEAWKSRSGGMGVISTTTGELRGQRERIYMTIMLGGGGGGGGGYGTLKDY